MAVRDLRADDPLARGPPAALSGRRAMSGETKAARRKRPLSTLLREQRQRIAALEARVKELEAVGVTETPM